MTLERPAHWLITRRTSRRAVLAAVPGMALLVAGVSCGGDDDDDDAAPTATTGSAATAPASTATTGTDAAATPGAEGSPSAGTDTEYRLIPLPPAELGAPAVPDPLPSANADALGVAEAAAAYDDFGTDAAYGEFPRTIRHAMGETVIEAQPVRVVVLDSGETDSVTQLGLTPVGALEYNPELVPDYIASALDGVTTVGTLQEPDLEAITALQPDLILSSKIRHEALYDTLSAIAPTVFGVSTGVVWKQNFKLHSQALGREAEGAATIEAYEAQVRAMNEILPDPRPTVSVVRVLADNLRYYQRANYSGTLLTDLGLPRPDSQNVDDFALLNQSLETIAVSADADYIFVSPTGGPEDDFAASMLDSPLWNSLSAVKAGNFRVVLDDVWMAGIGYRAAERIMNEIEESLVTEGSSGAGSTPATGSTGSTDGEWTFTDGRGVTITLPKRPERVVAHIGSAAALWDFGIEVVGVFGAQRAADGTPSRQAGRVDLDAVESLGVEWGEFDVEAMIALNPDLLVTTFYALGDTPETTSLWYVPDEVLTTVTERVPTAAFLAQDRGYDEIINDYATLAEALGADLSSPENTAAKAAFEKASADLTAAIEGNPGISVMVMAAGPDTVYIANPLISADIIFFTKLGMDVQAIADPAEFWEALSWEQIGKYPVDLILNDTRLQSLQPDQMAADHPTWNELPAVKAGQVGPWHAESTYSYLDYAEVLEELVPIFTNADPNVVA